MPILTLMDGDPGGLVDGAYRDFCVLVQAEVERVSQPSRTSNTRRHKVAKPWWSMELACLRKSVAVAQRRWLDGLRKCKATLFHEYKAKQRLFRSKVIELLKGVSNIGNKSSLRS